MNESTTLVVNGTGTIDYQAYCQYRLPCGYCTKLDKQCPMCCCTITPTWKVDNNPVTYEGKTK